MENLGTQDRLVSVGDVVEGRYTIQRQLGEGGFAKVYLAHDTVIERDVAVKFLDLRGIHGTDDMLSTVLERFRREAKLAARIRHRNVVNILDIGQVGSDAYRPFIVMELLDGYDLEEQLIDHGPMHPDKLMPLFIDCLDALGEAHELGIVHKDLKPSNLFLSDPGTRSEALRIVDFGIAHIKNGPGEVADEMAEASPEADRGGRLTATGQILGTLQYLTPEYIASQTVSPALDVYQMALILAEILSGERVIKTDNPFECLRIHTFGLLELPQYLLDSPLGPVLTHALTSDHNERIPDANAFAEALSKIDPKSIPSSPSLTGAGPVVTAQFLDTKSHGAIPSPRTNEIKAPTTGEHGSPQDNGLVPTLDPGYSPAPIISPNAGQESQVTAPLQPPEVEDELGGNEDHGTLKIVATAVVALILLAALAVGYLVTRPSDGGGEQPEIAQNEPDVPIEPEAPKVDPEPDPPAVDPVVKTPEPDPPAEPTYTIGPKQYGVRLVLDPKDASVKPSRSGVEVLDAERHVYLFTKKSKSHSLAVSASGYRTTKLSGRDAKLVKGELVEIPVSLKPKKGTKTSSGTPDVAKAPSEPADTTPSVSTSDLVDAVGDIEPDPPKVDPKPVDEPKTVKEDPPKKDPAPKAEDPPEDSKDPKNYRNVNVLD